MKFKTEDQKFLGRLLIFTPIPLNAQDVWFLNQFPMREVIKSVQHSPTNHFIPYVISIKTLVKVSYENLNEIPYVSLLYTTDYLIRLAFWAILIGL